MFSKPITWLSFALLAAVVLLALLAQRALLGTRAAESAASPTPTAGLAADIVIPPGSMTAPDFSLRDQDGKALAYYAPTGLTGHFQLWYLPLAVAATPSPTAKASPSASTSGSASSVVAPTPAPVPVQVTEGVDLSATSPPVWY